MNKFHVLLVLAWAVYFALHSILASFQVKDFVKSSLPFVHRYYRLIYNLIASGGLFFLLIINGAIASPLLITVSTFTTVLGLILATWGFLVIKLAFRCYSLKAFLGLENENDEVNPVLIRTGILGVIRHPIYSGSLLMLFGFLFYRPTTTNLVTVVCMCLYLIVGIYFEERKLVKVFGTKYISYKQEVPMLIPKIRFQNS